MMPDVKHLTRVELEAGLDHVRQAPRDDGELMLIVVRPEVEERLVLSAAELDVQDGLIGDNWRARGSNGTADGSAHPEMQLNIMNARAAQLVAQSRDRWPLAGDQLYVDLDLSEANLPPGTRLSIGTAIVEITPVPHNGCKKFTARFGLEAMQFVNSPVGKQLHLRGLNAKVIRGGTICVGDRIRKANAD